MNKSKSTMMLFITSIIFLCLFSNVQAQSSPCPADSYLTTCNDTTGVIKVDYYLNHIYQCTENLDETYIGNCPDGSGYTQIINMEEFEKFNFIMMFLFYSILAILLIWIFVKAIGIMNA